MDNVSVELRTRSGSFEVRHHDVLGVSAVSLSRGAIAEGVPLVRIHSSCLFSEAFDAVGCDCALQMRGALSAIDVAECGVLVYLFEEGRGAGLASKIRAMALERSEGIDTVEAFRRLGLPSDLRNHAAAAAVLRDLNISKNIALMTNNPEKRAALEQAGFAVDRIVPLQLELDDETRDYLKMKRLKLGHAYVDLS